MSGGDDGKVIEFRAAITVTAQLTGSDTKVGLSSGTILRKARIGRDGIATFEGTHFQGIVTDEAARLVNSVCAAAEAHWLKGKTIQ